MEVYTRVAWADRSRNLRGVSHNELWPAEPATQDDVTDTGDKGFVARMTRVPENAVQQVLAGKGCKVTSLLKPVVWTMRTNIENDIHYY